MVDHLTGTGGKRLSSGVEAISLLLYEKAIPAAMEMIERGFLSTEAKKKYKKIIGDRRRRFDLE